MATFDVNTADNYGGSGGGSFFSLKDDKDTAQVRFMYNSLEDVVGYAVHEIEVGGKKRYINCLREYNQPVDDCPLCAAKYRVIPKLFVQLYDVDANEVKVWDRGKNFFTKLSSLCSRYNPLVNTIFEVERNGRKGDPKTTYETFAVETDDTTLEDLPEVPELLGTLILDKTADEMEYFLETGGFENEGDSQPETKSQIRNPERDRRAAKSDSHGEIRRRTPANNHRIGKDKF